MALKISSITSIGWTVLSRLDENSPCPFSLQTLEHAIANEQVLPLLLQLDDENELIKTAISLGGAELEIVLSNAGSALSGRWARKTGISKNVNACVMAMVLEAIQQNSRSAE